MVTRPKTGAKSRAKSSLKPRTTKKPATKRAPPTAKVVKTKAKIVKVTAKKQATKQAVNTPDRDTLAKLRAHVDDIEKRLKRANSLTRTSVRALKTSYKALDGDNHTSALTGHIEELSDRLTGMIEQTRQDVAHDLKIVLGDPRLETLSSALTKANQRLTTAEQNQAEAINAINTHIARLATAVDERMQGEQRAREKGDALLGARIEKIELESADAITSLGDKVVSISEKLKQETQGFHGEMAEKAVLQQQDYEEHKHQIAQRIEAIEDEQRGQFPAFERDIETLNTRLEALESNVGMYAQTVEPSISEPAYEAAPQISTDPVRGTEPVDGSQSQYENTKSDDAFAALELVDMQAVNPPTSPHEFIPEFVPEVTQAPIVPEVSQAPEISQAYAPVEYTANMGSNMGANIDATASAVAGQSPEVFSPRAYLPGGQGETMAVEPTMSVATLSAGTLAGEVVADMSPSLTVVDNGPHIYTPEEAVNDILPPPMPPSPAMPNATVPDIQTLEPTMESVRPGAEPSDTSKAKKNKAGQFKLGGIASRIGKGLGKDAGGGDDGDNGLIRKVALFGGVAVVALFAFKTFAPKLSGSNEKTPQTTQATQATQAEPTKPQTTIAMSGDMGGAPQELATPSEQSFETVEPVGDYSQTMAAPDLGSKGTNAQTGQKKTLEDAASAGNAIAQFQLGLAHLEAGRDADAVRLIRLAANQGQPAAQYRLAKLYEVGIGVKVNGKTAKDLLTRSAEAGNRIAMHDLGHYYATGADGAAPNLQQAVKWFSMAAERGVLDSQFNLAVLYQGGTGVPRSLQDAYIWYAIAGAQGDKIAAQRSTTIARELSEDGLAKAKSRVKAYAPKPVDNAANGIFKNLPWIVEKQASVKPRQNTSLKSVKGAQKMLAALGYSVGKPDGNLGPNTRNAIIKFERANGMPETGRVNAALLERLQLAVGV